MNTTMVVTFDVDTLVRMSFFTPDGKPIDVDRGLNVACSAYRTKIGWPLLRGLPFGGDPIDVARASIIAMNDLAVPAIRVAHVEGDAGILANYEADECSTFTASVRKGRPLAAWRQHWNADASAKRETQKHKSKVKAFERAVKAATTTKAASRKRRAA
jgi:hypothetical protein